MKYTVKLTSPITWEVEKEDGDEHYVRYDVFKERFICDCMYNSMTEMDCKHIIFCKINLVFKKTEINDEDLNMGAN